MSVNVGLDGRGRYHKRWTAFGLGCGAFKLPWEPFFDAHIMPKKGWISSLDCSLSGIGRHARLGMVWGFNILFLFRFFGSAMGHTWRFEPIWTKREHRSIYVQRRRCTTNGVELFNINVRRDVWHQTYRVFGYLYDLRRPCFGFLERTPWRDSNAVRGVAIGGVEVSEVKGAFCFCFCGFEIHRCVLVAHWELQHSELEKRWENPKKIFPRFGISIWMAIFQTLRTFDIDYNS